MLIKLSYLYLAYQPEFIFTFLNSIIENKTFILSILWNTVIQYQNRRKINQIIWL